MSAYPDYLPLGPGPRPIDGADLLARVRAVAGDQGLGGALAAGMDAVLAGTTVILDGDDVTSAVVDATGVVIPESAFTSAATADAADLTDLPAVVGETRGTMHLGTFQAHPITVADVPVEIDAEVRDLPLRWIDAADGTVGVEPLPPTAEHPVTGHLRVSAPKAAVLDAVRRVATAVLAEQGVTLVRLDVELTSTGPREVRLRAEAKLRRGILSASAHASGTATVDSALVLRFSDVSLGSANPIVAGLLAVARSRVQEATRRPIDLAEQLPPGVRVADVRLDAGTELVLSARLA
ncbi:hypothetical protein [Serinibacter arcticus]|uniref:Uncharacterized protein n=1 Tax=Serinibacter arcticus TaxID=1655435 RepID=A0A4Z1E7D1_9MICO|nr:hypothetical protein [Serinibacter arcticus]TGO06602.1 hypothetical protein SERN_0794 [Serinibacter arcticus]